MAGNLDEWARKHIDDAVTRRGFIGHDDLMTAVNLIFEQVHRLDAENAAGAREARLKSVDTLLAKIEAQANEVADLRNRVIALEKRLDNLSVSLQSGIDARVLCLS